MIFPRNARQRRTYGQRKVIAAIVTFLVLWSLAKITGFDDSIRRRVSIAPPPPSAATAFEERMADVTIEDVGIVEGWSENTVAQDLLLRTLDGHPISLSWSHESDLAPPAIGDTLRIRAVYEWNAQGGSLRILEGDSDTWVRAEGF